MITEPDFFDWVIKGILATSFAGWAFIIRYFGGKYIATQEQIQKELTEIRIEIALLKAERNRKEDE
jgi:hypothetical protein